MRPQVAATRLRWDKYRDACDDNDCHGMTLRQQQRNCSPPNYAGGSGHKETHRIFHSLRGKLCIGIHRDVEVSDATGEDSATGLATQGTSGTHRQSCRPNGGGAGRASGHRRHYRLSARDPRSDRPSSCVRFGPTGGLPDAGCHGMTLRQQQRNCSPPNYAGGSSHKETHRTFHSRGKLCIGIHRDGKSAMPRGRLATGLATQGTLGTLDRAADRTVEALGEPAGIVVITD